MNNTEKKLADYFGRRFCYITGSGTTAIYILLQCIKRPGMRVLYPAITCMVPVNAAVYLDMEPVFCDINLNNYTMDIKSLKSMLDKYDIDVIVPTHIYGNSCDMDRIIELAKAKDIFVLEDAAQAIGGEYKGKKLGGFGDAAIISFGHTKLLECGGGGAVLTDNKELYSELEELGRKLPDKPEDANELFDEYRMKYYSIMRNVKEEDIRWQNMLELQLEYRKAFIYNIDDQVLQCIQNKFCELPFLIEARKERSLVYDNILDKKWIMHREIAGDIVPWRYSFLYKGNREKLLERVRAAGVDISSWYPPLHKMYSRQEDSFFPNAIQMGNQIINLWVTPAYTLDKIKSDAAIVSKLLEE